VKSAKIAFKNNLGVLVTLVVIVVFFSLRSPFYLRPRNIMNILNHSTITIILASGMAFVLATGGVDLSVGSTLGFTGVVVGYLMIRGVPWPLAVLSGLAVGAGIGAFNGFVIAKARIQPFIMTLAMLSIVRGMALVISQGQPVSGFPLAFTQLFAGRVFGIPTNVLFALGVFGILAYLGMKTRYGLYVRSVGGGEDSADICGIPVLRLKIMVYTVSGFLAAVSSLVFMSFMDAAEPLAGLQTEWLEAIAAPIIGGASLSGGVLSLPGTLMGALILAALRNGLNIVGVQPFFQQLFIGLIIIISVIVDAVRTRRQEALVRKVQA
jgi:ribose transport system permease protein